MNRTYLILIGVIVVLAAGLIGLLLYLNGQPDATRGITPLTEIAAMDPDSEKWGVNYPNQYTTLLKTETNNERTVFGASNPYSKLEQDPPLLTLLDRSRSTSTTPRQRPLFPAPRSA